MKIDSDEKEETIEKLNRLIELSRYYDYGDGYKKSVYIILNYI